MNRKELIKKWVKDRFDGIQDTLIGFGIVTLISSASAIGVIYVFHDFFSQRYFVSIYILTLLFIVGILFPISISLLKIRFSKEDVIKVINYGEYFELGWEWRRIGDSVVKKSLTPICPKCRTELKSNLYSVTTSCHFECIKDSCDFEPITIKKHRIEIFDEIKMLEEGKIRSEKL